MYLKTYEYFYNFLNENLKNIKWEESDDIVTNIINEELKDVENQKRQLEKKLKTLKNIINNTNGFSKVFIVQNGYDEENVNLDDLYKNGEKIGDFSTLSKDYSGAIYFTFYKYNNEKIVVCSKYGDYRKLYK